MHLYVYTHDTTTKFYSNYLNLAVISGNNYQVTLNYQFLLHYSVADHWGTTEDFVTRSLSLFPASHNVLSQMLLSHFFLCLHICHLWLFFQGFFWPSLMSTWPAKPPKRAFIYCGKKFLLAPILFFTSSSVTQSQYNIPKTLPRHFAFAAWVLLYWSLLPVSMSHRHIEILESQTWIRHEMKNCNYFTN